MVDSSLLPLRDALTADAKPALLVSVGGRGLAVAGRLRQRDEPLSGAGLWTRG